MTVMQVDYFITNVKYNYNLFIFDLAKPNQAI